MLRAREPGAFERPELLREVASLQEWLIAQPEIGATTSVVQYLEVLNEALGPEEIPTRRIPDSENLIAQLLLFGANEELDVLLDRAHQVITVMVRSTETETREFDLLARRIDARLAELPDEISGHTTGNAILLTRAANRIALGQALSLLAASAMIGLLLIGYFKSVRLGLYALIPNLMPVLLYFGLLGATGVTLNNSTALMGSIVLGIAVDDTLHLLVEYRRALRGNVDVEEALRHALVHVGRPITCTTLAICVGLLVIGGSDLRNQAEFGMLGSATLAIAWLVDITVTPALCLRLIRRA
jgi:predicted RND superfamily exporter protein